MVYDVRRLLLRGRTPGASVAGASRRRVPQGVEQAPDLVGAKHALELEAGAAAAVPDQEGLDVADCREAHGDALAPAEIARAARHEPGRRDIGDMQPDLAAPAMLADSAVIDRVASGAARFAGVKPWSAGQVAHPADCCLAGLFSQRRPNNR